MSVSYAKILDNIHNQIAVIDSSEKLIYCNQLFESLLLLYNSEILNLKGIQINDLFINELKPIRDAVKKCLKDGNLIKTQFSFLYLGRLSFFAITVIPEHGKSTLVDQCILIMHNNTDMELNRRELNSKVLFFSNLIKRLPIGVYLFDQSESDLIVSLWNPSMTKIFNTSENEMIHQPLETVFDNKTIKRHKKALMEIKNTGLYYELPAEYIQTPSGMRYFHTILAPIEEKENKPPQSFLGIMTDVTEKIESDLKLKRYQKELKTALKSKSEELLDTSSMFMSIMENSYGIDIFALNTNLEYLLFNTHHKIMIQRNYGLEIEIGKSFTPVLELVNDEKIKGLYSAALEGKSTVTELKLKLPDNSYSYMDVVISPLKSQEGIIGITNVFLETTNIRELEKEAQTFKKIAENAEYGVLLTDNQYNIQFINQYMLKILQIDNENPLGMNLESFIPPDQFDLIQHSAHYSLSKKMTGQLEIDLFQEEHDSTSLLVTISGYETMDGDDDGIAFTCVDISPMKEARVVLEEARNRAENASIMKSSFVANMSHEIRTPLNAVLGFAKLMEDKLENPKLENYLKNILSSGEILRSLINDILDFSKIEAGKMSINREQCNIAEFFQEIFSLFELKANEKKLELEIFSSSDIPEFILVDPLRLRQVILNLVSNTIKFTHWGYIKIRISTSEDLLTIVVSDTGIGIPTKDLPDIFHPFEQQEKQDARQFEGTGLGLSIVEKLMKLMDGTVQVSSDLWKGSSFTLKLPLQNEKTHHMKSFHYHNEIDMNNNFICLTEDSFLNEELINAGRKYNIQFRSLNKTKREDITKSKMTAIILSHKEEDVSGTKDMIEVPLVASEKLTEYDKDSSTYFIREDLECDKIAAILFSIFLWENKNDSSPLLPYMTLSTECRSLLYKAVKSHNFNDIEALIPLLKTSGAKGIKLAEQLHDYTDNFDIFALRKTLKQIETELSEGE